MISDKLWLTVNDIKQYLYCPRIVFFNHVMPVERKTTFKMELGRSIEEKIQMLESRRKFKKYGLDQGKRQYHLQLRSDELGFSGNLDMLIITPRGYFPVDFKYTESFPRKNHQYQLGGYALLIEKEFSTEVTKGFVFHIRRNNILAFNLTREIKIEILKIVEEMRAVIKREIMPPATDRISKCSECEFKNYCGDIF